ncbi:VQ motif-containing protein [Corchorus capsularis]|uniref:VQ motif-containing protein n=1 Tax=Corchorus capsularis TaxID=210143 RepID=A0A1R3HX72_COCAP|nr:VQ motif-containing protein [Corchorus capsularis]
MNETTSSTDQWMQFYQQTFDTSFDFSDATTVTTTGSSNNTSFDGGCGGGGGVNQLTPKGCISKPIRRRSRVSKRTPITLLNADAKNFRSLVQKLTGCRRRSTSISFGNPTAKGPVNINFALGSHSDIYSPHANSISQLLTTNDYSPNQSQLILQQEKDEHRDQQQNYQQQLSNSTASEEGECHFSDNYDSITTDDFLLASCLPRTAEIPQGFLMDDMYFLA